MNDFLPQDARAIGVKVPVYVEGPSDKRGMEVLLGPLLKQKRTDGISIEFFASPTGDKKAVLLTRVPKRAVNILSNDILQFQGGVATQRGYQWTPA